MVGLIGNVQKDSRASEDERHADKGKGQPQYGRCKVDGHTLDEVALAIEDVYVFGDEDGEHEHFYEVYENAHDALLSQAVEGIREG